MRLNERRQARTFIDLADEHEVMGTGVLAYREGTFWACKAVGIDLDEPLTDGDVQRVVDFYRSRELPPLLELTAFSDESTFAAAARGGFALVEAENVLSRVPASLTVDLSDGLRITDLDPDDPVAMRRHAEIVCSGFPPPDGHIPESVVASAIDSQRQSTARGFLVRDGQDEPVAASGMEVTAVDPGGGEAVTSITALWGTTVLPAYRRRGVQRSLIAHRVRIGFEQGSKLAVIESKPGIPTARNAARLGFALTYTRLILRA